MENEIDNEIIFDEYGVVSRTKINLKTVDAVIGCLNVFEIVFVCRCCKGREILYTLEGNSELLTSDENRIAHISPKSFSMQGNLPRCNQCEQD